MFGFAGPYRLSPADAWGGFIDAFPDWSVQVERTMETTDGSVVVECVLGGTQAKDIMGMES